MDNKVKYGLLGVGKLTSKSLIPAFKFCESSELVALGSQNIKSAKEKVKSSPEDIFWGSYEEVLNHPEVQVIYIVLPNHLHKKWTIQAMQAGKAVLCEKPLCMNKMEFEEIQLAAQHTGQIFREAFMYRFHPQYKKVFEILNSGVLGKLQLFRAQFSYHLTDASNIRLKTECGGGALMDVGCYLLDSLLWLSGQKVKKSSIFSQKEENGTDQSTSLMLEMELGLQAQLFCSTRSSRIHQIQIFGENGSLEIPQAYIPAAGKQVHLILKSDQGQEVTKLKGVNQYSAQLDDFSRHFMGENPENSCNLVQTCDFYDLLGRFYQNLSKA